MISLRLDPLLKINISVVPQHHIMESDYILEVGNGTKFN